MREVKHLHALDKPRGNDRVEQLDPLSQENYLEPASLRMRHLRDEYRLLRSQQQLDHLDNRLRFDLSYR